MSSEEAANGNPKLADQSSNGSEATAAPNPASQLSKDLNYTLKLAVLICGFVFINVTLSSFLWKRTLYLNHIKETYENNTKSMLGLTSQLHTMMNEYIQLRNALSTQTASTNNSNTNSSTTCINNFKARYDNVVDGDSLLKLHLSDMYDIHIKLLRTFPKGHYYKQDPIVATFPYAEFITQLVMLALCIAVFTLLFMKLNPFELATKVSNINKCIADVDVQSVYVQSVETACRESLKDQKDSPNFDELVAACVSKKTNAMDANIAKCKVNASIMGDENDALFKVSLTLAIVTASAFVINLIASSTLTFQSSLEARNLL